MAVTAAVALVGCSDDAIAPIAEPTVASIDVGFVRDRPTPATVAGVAGDVSIALAVDVDFAPYDTDEDLLAALVDGDIDVAHGVSPAALLDATVTASIAVIGVAAEVTASPCVTHPDARLTPDNAAQQLIDATILVEVGSAEELHLRSVLDLLGVDDDATTATDLAGGPVGINAFAAGGAAVLCTAVVTELEELRELGARPLASPELRRSAGAIWYELVVADRAFLDIAPGAARALLVAMAPGGAARPRPPAALAADAASAHEIDVEEAAIQVAARRELTIEEQRSDAWLGAAVPTHLERLRRLGLPDGPIAADEAVAISLDVAGLVDVSLLDDLAP